MSQLRIRSLALMAASLAVSGAALAQSKTWTLNDTSTAAPSTAVCTQTSAGGTNGIGNSYGCAQQPTGNTNTLAITGWANTAGGFFAAAAVTPQGGNGYGVGNAGEGGTTASSSSPDFSHSVDNNGSIDMLLLKFTSGAEALTHVTVGWTGTGGDGDFQILRWTGGAPANDSALLTNRTRSTLVSAGGWQLVSQINLAGSIDNPDAFITDFNKNNLTSSYWLLSAYNSDITGGAAGTRHDAATAGIDALKFLAVGTTTPGRVPEPVSLALVATALVGVGFSRRRKA